MKGLGPLQRETMEVAGTVLIFWQNKLFCNFLGGIFYQNCFITDGCETEMDYFDKQQTIEE